MYRQSGLGLVSVLVLIVGIGAIVAVASPMALTIMQEAKMRATLSEMRLLSEAIALYHPDEAGGFGFVGDIGRFPNSLSELVEQGALPAWDITTGVGWQGPYIEQGFAAVDLYSLDGWGNPYIYSATTGVITSLGSDGAAGGSGYAADFSTENLSARRHGCISGQLRDVLGAPLPGVAVSVEEPVDGRATWRTPVTTDSGGFYSFSGVIVGKRRIRATFGGFTHYLHTIVTPHLEAKADFNIAVDVTIPQAPAGLTATPEVFGGISLNWLPPTSNTDGTAITDLAGFNIYRSTTAGFTPAFANRLVTLRGPVHFFEDRAVSSHYIYHYIIRAFDKLGNESANSTSVSADTANGSGPIRNVARVTQGTGSKHKERIVVGIRNFSASPITVSRIKVSWTAWTGGPTHYSRSVATHSIRTRIPTSQATWTTRGNDPTPNDTTVNLDTNFTLAAYGLTDSEGIFRVGFVDPTDPIDVGREVPMGTAITVVLNPGAGESRFEVIWYCWEAEG